MGQRENNEELSLNDYIGSSMKLRSTLELYRCVKINNNAECLKFVEVEFSYYVNCTKMAKLKKMFVNIQLQGRNGKTQTKRRYLYVISY